MTGMKKAKHLAMRRSPVLSRQLHTQMTPVSRVMSCVFLRMCEIQRLQVNRNSKKLTVSLVVNAFHCLICLLADLQALNTEHSSTLSSDVNGEEQAEADGFTGLSHPIYSRVISLN
jgi:hypothetical protein